MMEHSAARCDIGLMLNESCELTEESEFYVLRKEKIDILELRTQCCPLMKILPRAQEKISYAVCKSPTSLL